MKMRLISLLLLTVLVVSACQSVSPTPGGTTNLAVTPKSAETPNLAGTPKTTGSSKPVASSLKYIFEPPSDPVSVSVALDSGRKADAVIPIKGGSLSAKGVDGTVYTLVIPGDALLVETRITMTPVQSLSGLPFGGGPALAVQLEPEGLAFNNFVTLKITPTAEIAIDQQIFYSYQKQGQNVALAIPVVDSKEIQLRLMHFSGYGVTKGLLADIEPVRKRLGGDVDARIQSALAEKLAHERQRQLLGAQDSSIGDDMASAFREYIDKVLKQRIAAAGESCAAGRLAIQSALGVSRQAQLLGAEDISNEVMDQFPSLMETVGLVCLKEEYELCKEQHIIHRMIPVWLGFGRQMQLLGVEDSSVQQKAKQYTEKCLNFELVFESDGNFDAGFGGGYQSRVKAKIPLKFDSSKLAISGKSALINEEFNFKVPECSVESRRGGGEISVANMAYIPDTKSPTDVLGYVRDFKLSYFPGVTSESFTVTCEDNPPFTSPPGPYWWGIYLVLHKNELAISSASDGQLPGFSDMFSSNDGMPMFTPPQGFGEQGFILEDWEVPAGELFAKKEWIKEDKSNKLVEAGTFKLYHRPQ